MSFQRNMAYTTSPLQSNGTTQFVQDRFLVCGLDILGQYCVKHLKEFGVVVGAVAITKPDIWEIPELETLLDELILGDCRQSEVLLAANVDKCRGVLIVTENEQINVATSLAVRQLNPNIRIVIRSSKENLNELLGEQLGNFIAYEPTQLPAQSFAIGSLGDDTVGFFNLEGNRLRVGKLTLQGGEEWCSRPLQEFSSRTRRLIAQMAPQQVEQKTFYDWEPKAIPSVGDTLIYIELADNAITYSGNSSNQKVQKVTSQKWWRKVQEIINKLQEQIKQEQIRRVAFFCTLIVILLWITGALLFDSYYPETEFVGAAYASAMLLLGGFPDLFGDFQDPPPIPWWLHLYSLVLTLSGTAFVGVIYAMLTEYLLSSKFKFVQIRPPVPTQGHILVIGLGRIGLRVASILQEYKQLLVGVTSNQDFDRSIQPQMPLIVGNIHDALPKANIGGAKSVVIVTEDEILNLEIALMVRKYNPDVYLVVRTYGEALSNKLAILLPNCQALGTYSAAAEAFAGAAFGENILTIFNIAYETILVTEYEIDVGDTLDGLLISEISYGYGVSVVLHQRLSEASKLLPSQDIKVTAGDRLIILSSMEGLARIEQGNMNTINRCWQVKIEKALDEGAIFEGQRVIARVCGCSLTEAAVAMKHIPHTLSIPLYKHQAERLIKELKKNLVQATLVAYDP